MTTVKPSRVKEGTAEKHGAIWDGKGTNFTCFSAHATKVEICLFDPRGEQELERLTLPEYTDGFWHGLHPGRASGLGLWPAGAWAVRARGRPSLQSEQVAARPLCTRTHPAS